MAGMQATQLAVLQAVSVGMWSAKKDQGMWFLIVPRRHLFVIIVESEDGGHGKRQRFAPSTTALLRQLGAHSPFSSHAPREGGCAFAFEVAFDNVTGIDYQNSLVRPGKLVLEAFAVKKREFESLDAAFSYYGGADGEATRASLEALFGEGSPTKQGGWGIGAASPAGSLVAATAGSLSAATTPLSCSPEKAVPLGPRDRTRVNLLARLGGALAREKAKDASRAARAVPPSPPRLRLHNPMGEPREYSEPLPALDLSTTAAIDDAGTPPATSGASTPRLFDQFPRQMGGDWHNTLETRQPSLRLSHSTGDLQTGWAAVAAAAAAAPAATTYDFRLITVQWADPQLPEALRPVIEGSETLLKMYESGLPTWATFFPRAGLYYRPWLRTLTWFLFYAFSFFSLAVGFYDLYKTLPGLQALLSRAMAGLWLPPAAVLQWIEEHAQIRLSILLTYIFGKSEMFLYTMRLLGHAKRALVEAAGPLWAVAVPPIVALFQTSVAPIVSLARAAADLGATVVLPPLQALYSTVALPAAWVAQLARAAAAAGQGMAAGGAAAGAASPWLLRAIPVDALEALRSSLGRATRAANSVWTAIVRMVQAFSRHRLTLARRARRMRVRAKERLIAALWFPFEFLAACLRWGLAIANLMVEAGKAGAERAREERKAAEAAAAGGGVAVGDETSAVAKGPSEDTEGWQKLDSDAEVRVNGVTGSLTPATAGAAAVDVDAPLDLTPVSSKKDD